MNDNFLSSVTGSLTSCLAMLVGLIQVQTVIEVIFYGLIGGAVGYLGKWVVQIIRFYLEKKFKPKS